MASMFLPESPLPPRVPAILAQGLHRVAGTLAARLARRYREPGASLDLLPEAPLPDDLGWAADRPAIGAAFARAIAAIEAAGATAVPDCVRQVVCSQLSTWDGQPPELSPGWIDDALGGLGGADRSTGRLALLLALAPYRVSERVVEEYRRTGAGDATLVAVASWASLTAARRLGRSMADGLRTRD
jgi:hypothetical protein